MAGIVVLAAHVKRRLSVGPTIYILSASVLLVSANLHLLVDCESDQSFRAADTLGALQDFHLRDL